MVALYQIDPHETLLVNRWRGVDGLAQPGLGGGRAHSTRLSAVCLGCTSGKRRRYPTVYWMPTLALRRGEALHGMLTDNLTNEVQAPKFVCERNTRLLVLCLMEIAPRLKRITR